MRAALVVIGGLFGATQLVAQSMYSYSTVRQWHGETRLAAAIDFAAGTIRLAPAQGSVLYRLDVEYDQERFHPLSRYTSDGQRVTLGLEPVGEWELRVPSKQQLAQRASVAISPAVELDLEATFGAVDAELELGGLQLSHVALKTGASRVVVTFSNRNQIPCRSAVFAAGAAELKVERLGNSRCRDISLEGGVGSVTLDFSGTWTSDSRVRLMMAAGELTLRLPRTVGVRMTVEKSLIRFEPTGFVRRGSEYFSENYSKTERSIEIALTTSFAGLAVEWID